ncbi:SDR family oxidoreductase [Undibacterium sp. Jales W-56]|uniref:SDR family NAD(P)-dependent oxidoreductase n=1 Tax=Undibacterium sp. Jales W-56 TaxID=2897325 RepID=UPI0021CF6E21|nr:SDR family oxidoreductase [Undibacterium sp. Jales W-56]MCU6433031.1 SDR family oxidoreductase [Undibacterium sp. Jales W-56]
MNTQTREDKTTLAGKHALVTGGGKGIGLAIASTLLEQGAAVTISGRNEHTLQDAMRYLHGKGSVSYVLMDVTDLHSVQQAFEHAIVRKGRVDILINNAGQAVSAPFLKTSADMWQQMMAVNLSGAFHCTQQVLPAMLEVGWGRIVNVASTAALTGYAYVAAYCAAKHGVLGMTRALALEVASKGVTVNAVCPGYTETDMVADAVANIVAKTGRTDEQARTDLAAGNPQKRFVQPDEVAHSVAWLCQPAAAAMNGQAIAVAGGEVM